MRSDEAVFDVRFWLVACCVFAASVGCFARAAAATQTHADVEAEPTIRVGVMVERLRPADMTALTESMPQD